ncbi:MAG: DedA family protein [Gemmatimonadetes bacterium]|nr:DedA family protein [Gemmatimonadota bacterium]
MLEGIVNWLADTIFRLGYPGIALLMAIESSFIPFPSEVVMPPAGFLAAQGRMNVWLALAAGVAGSIIGALVNYTLAVALGRPLLHKYGKYFLVKEASLERAESFFRRHGEISTFVGRLIPVIRQYISLPAGLARMRLSWFIVYTAAGAGTWCAILTYIGWYLGRHADVLRREDVQRYSWQAMLALVPVLALVIGLYVYARRRRRRERAAGLGGEGSAVGRTETETS